MRCDIAANTVFPIGWQDVAGHEDFGHSNRVLFCNRHNLGRDFAVDITTRTNNQRILGRGQFRGKIRNRIWIWVWSRRGNLGGSSRHIRQFAKGFARKREVDGALRFHTCNRGTSADKIGCVFSVTQFIIPFDRFTHDSGLVKHFLTVLDRCVAAAHALPLGQRVAAGHHKDWHIVGVRVQQTHRRIGQANVHVHRRSRHFAGCEVVAMRHGHNHVFMRGGDGFWDLFAAGLGVGLDHRCKVRTRIDKEIVDPIGFKGTQDRFACGNLFSHR